MRNILEVIKKLSWTEFEKEFDVAIRSKLRASRLRENVKGMAILRCHVLDSSRCGHITALQYGPNNTFKTLKDMDIPQGIYTTGLPSSASFPEAYTEDLPDSETYTWTEEDIQSICKDVPSTRGPEYIKELIKEYKSKLPKGTQVWAGKLYSEWFIVTPCHILYSEYKGDLPITKLKKKAK